jgi:hypothetical protein
LVGRTGFAVALLPVAAVAFYNYGNLQRTGKFHFSSNQAFNAIYYYYPFIAATSGNDSAGRFLTAERAKTAAITNYAERYNYANGRGMALLQQNFGRYMLFHIRHTARILIEPGKAEMDLFTGRLTYGRLFNKNEKGFFRMIQTEGPGGLPAYAGRNPSLFLALIVLLFNCVRLAGIYFFIRSSKLPGRLVLFPLAIIAYFAFAAGPIANTRYFLPVSLISIGCAAVGWATRKQTRS